MTNPVFVARPTNTEVPNDLLELLGSAEVVDSLVVSVVDGVVTTTVVVVESVLVMDGSDEVEDEVEVGVSGPAN